MSYNDTNRHPRDSRLQFDPAGHVYSVDGHEYESVTTVVEKCFEQFDADRWARAKATATRTAEMIKKEWEENGRIARNLGTAMHQHIEQYYLGEDTSDAAATDPSFEIFLHFARVQKLLPYRTEWPIFIEEHRIAGTLDFLEFDGENYNIYDWKRSTKLTDDWGRTIKDSPYRKFAKPPLSELPDTTYYHYALQLSIYRYILHEKYGIEVANSYLGVFHPKLGCPYIISVPYLRQEVETLLRWRASQR